MQHNAKPNCFGLRLYRQNVATGTFVGLYSGGNGGDESGRWQTVCEDHGTILNHRTLAGAVAWLTYSQEWCSECRALRAERLIHRA